MSRSQDANPMLTVKAAAQRANVSQRTIRRLIKAGRLPCHRFGRAVRIGEADLLQATRRA